MVKYRNRVPIMAFVPSDEHVVVNMYPVRIFLSGVNWTVLK